MKGKKENLFRELSQSEKILLPVDTLRQGVDGIFDTLKNTVFLLVAIQFYHAGDHWNSLISAAVAGGMLAAIFLTPFLEKRFFPRTILVVSTFLMALSLLVPLAVPGEEAYALGISFCLFLTSLRIPFFTGYYSECYRADRMARLMSVGTLIMFLLATGSSWLFGHMLEQNLRAYRSILILSALLIMANGFFLMKLPAGNEPAAGKLPFWENLKLIWQDPRFGIASLSWMVLGFANLWSTPIRTVFLSDPERGLGLDPMTVLLILGIIPGIVRLLSNFFWARFYDKAPFVVMRMAMNIIIGLGFFFFFISRNLWIIGLGSILIYMSLAGAPFVWNLWVMRLAPAGEARRYMSVHSFLCGIRGLAGPPLAFLFIQSHDIREIGMISVVLAFLSVIILLPLLLVQKYRF